MLTIVLVRFYTLLAIGKTQENHNSVPLDYVLFSEATSRRRQLIS